MLIKEGKKEYERTKEIREADIAITTEATTKNTS